mgnify:CR=1 FL=1
MFENLKKWIRAVLNTPNFTPFSPWKEDPGWILFCRLVMLGSVFSLIGLLVISLDPVAFYLNLPSHLRFPFLLLAAILFLLAIIFGTPVYVYERKRMRAWLLVIAQKEGIHVEEDLDNSEISRKLVKKLKRKVIENYVFSEENN